MALDREELNKRRQAREEERKKRKRAQRLMKLRLAMAVLVLIACGVGLAAWKAICNGDSGDAAALQPNYLRLSQAERERLARENISKGETNNGYCIRTEPSSDPA